MSQLGLGVMLGILSGNEQSVIAFTRALNKEIAMLVLKDNKLRFTFTDGSRMSLFDDGQSCCETRYMTTDDDLAGFVGAVLLDAEVANAPDVASSSEEEHEVAFLKVKTSRGVFTVETHNEHNGYYGGFSIRAE